MITILKKYRHSVHTDSLGTRVVFKFQNEYGASVIKGQYTYGGPVGLYEVAVLRWNDEFNYEIDYSTPITDDVIGYLTTEEVVELLYKIQTLPENKLCITESHKALTCDAKTPSLKNSPVKNH